MNITGEQMDFIVKVYEEHGDEYRRWCNDHGKPHLREWKDMNGDASMFTGEFAYYILSRFMEWKSSNGEA